MQTQHSKSTKKYHDNFDFIIPFLINDHKHAGLQKTKDRPSFKLSEPYHHQLNLQQNTTTIMKVYGTKKQKKKSFINNNPQQSSILLQPNYNSQIKRKVHKIFQKFPFFKAQSQLKYAVSTQQNPKKTKIMPRDVSKEGIRGIIFKSKRKNEVNEQKIQMIEPQTQFTEWRQQIRTSLKYRKERGCFDKRRCQNVDLILNRKCISFVEHISEYQRRLQMDEGVKIFIFDSKDHWMRRVLINKGWIENINKQSKAFHLYWGNKPYKQHSFPQQLLNHYPNSDLMTSKVGLHNMLKKYNLLHLQPITFDLSSQKPQFTTHYKKVYFISKLKKLMNKIQFQGNIKKYTKQQLKIKINSIDNKININNINNNQLRLGLGLKLQLKLLYIIDICFLILENICINKDIYVIDEAYEEIMSKMKLNQREEEYIRWLFNLEELMKNNQVLQNYFGIGDQNIWIIKSKNSSKGAGISLHKDFDSIVKNDNKIAQKYIENPLIFLNQRLKGRKFDVRVWVLVTGGDNPSIYYHQKFYGRVCYQPYSIETINLNKQHKHLTNFSHNKYRFNNKRLSQSIFLPQSLFKMIESQIKMDYRSKFYIDIQRILKKLQIIFKNEITKGSLNNFQLFGFDLLIDQSLHMHLLQINLSAHCQERHEELTAMLQDMGNGIIDILQYQKQAKLYGWKAIH